MAARATPGGPLNGLRAGALALALAVFLAVVAVLVFATPDAAVVPTVGVSPCEVANVEHIAPAPATAAPPRGWPAHLLQRGVLSGALDPATTSAYEITANSMSDHGYGRLERINWRTHTLTHGPSFRVAGLGLASGSLWVFGGETLLGVPTGPVLCQVNQQSLTLTRQIPLPPASPIDLQGFGMTLTAGPRHTVWVGYDRTVALVSTTTGDTLRTLTMPSGYVSDLAASPDHRLLYVSLSYPTVDGQMIDAQVLEFTQQGTMVAATNGGTASAVAWSVAGGEVVGVPNGVAYSARTGMDGETVLLTSGALATVTPPGLRNNETNGYLQSPDDVFAWPMDATTMYGGGSLWVADGWGVLACVNPGTGVVRALEGQPRLHGRTLDITGEALQLLATDPTTHTVFALAGNELYAITAPAPCWNEN